MRFLFNFSMVLPEIFLALFLVFFIFYVFYLRVESDIEGVVKTPLLTRSLTLIILYALIVTFLLLTYSSREDGLLFSGVYYTSEIIVYIKMFVILLSIGLLPIFYSYLDEERMQGFEVQLLFLFCVFSLILLPSVNDFLFLYILLELQSLSMYVLAASRRNQVLSVEAGLKYFVLGSLASGFLLFGVSLVYGLLGTTNFVEIGYLLLDIEFFGILVIAFFLILTGFCFKLALFPFYVWAPDVYEGSPIAVTALFATLPKLPVLFVLLRFIYLFFGQTISLSVFSYQRDVLAILGVFSIMIGTLGALYQVSLRRLVAYSGILNIGYIFLVLQFTHSVVAILFYILIYLVLTLNFFYILVSLRRTSGILITNIVDIKGLARSSPVLAFALALNMFSMAGIPPLAGFFGKFFLIYSITISDQIFFLLFFLVFSVISSVYYIRLVKLMYFDKVAFNQIKSPSVEVSFVLSFTTFLNIFFIFIFEPIFYFLSLLM